MMKRIFRLPDDVRLGYDLSSVRVCGISPSRARVAQGGVDRLARRGAHLRALRRHRGPGDDGHHRPEWLEHKGSVGRPASGEFMIADLDGNPLPPGEQGEVWIRTTAERPTYRYVGAEPDGSRAAGRASATWAGSTPTATSTSATGCRT